MKDLSVKERHKAFTGALYDFAGYLTLLKDGLIVGEKYDVWPLMEAMEKWAKENGLNIENSDSKWKNYL